jgi:hypothetical protein
MFVRKADIPADIRAKFEELGRDPYEASMTMSLVFEV